MVTACDAWHLNIKYSEGTIVIWDNFWEVIIIYENSGRTAFITATKDDDISEYKNLVYLFSLFTTSFHCIVIIHLCTFCIVCLCYTCHPWSMQLTSITRLVNYRTSYIWFILWGQFRLTWHGRGGPKVS